MRIEYKVINGSAQIIRCFGSDPVVVLPEMVDGYEVKSVAAYAFSARKSTEDLDVLVYRTEGDRTDRSLEMILAGERVEQVIFPDTVEEIGNYIFYGCKMLEKLEFSDNLVSLGSGAFTGCGRIRALKVHLYHGRKTCVKEILGDLWQRIDVEFVRGEQCARFVFPEHYEEAVENTPARILFTQHHGSGNLYRQCFYSKELDCGKYDEIFPLAVVQDPMEVLADMTFGRLMGFEEMTKSSRERYEGYLKEHLIEISQYLIEKLDLKTIKFLSERKYWDKETLDEVIRLASKEKDTEIVSFLMNERNRCYREQITTERKKKFAL